MGQVGGARKARSIQGVRCFRKNYDFPPKKIVQLYPFFLNKFVAQPKV